MSAVTLYRVPGFVLGDSYDLNGCRPEFRRLGRHKIPSWIVRVCRLRNCQRNKLLLIQNRAGFFPGAVFLIGQW